MPLRHPSRRPLSVMGLALLVAVIAIPSLAAVSAKAVILPAVTLDGPSEDIVGFGGVAIAEDGSGGVVYLKRVGGVAHVFVSRYVEGHWLAPIQVDTQNPFAASWPRIGAADGGELEVVWETPFATEGSRPADELLGATMGGGASSFGPPIIIDPAVRNGTGANPDLAMSSTGQADLVYRVFNSPGETSNVPLLRPGDVVGQVRVAHFDGERWSRLGAINRDLGASLRPPSRANAPAIALGPTGNGIVVWQEPDIAGVARIWARRIFGHSLDYVLPVSASNLNGVPIEGEADAMSAAVTRVGQAEVAYRQAPAPGATKPGTQILLNTLPDGESLSGAMFLGAQVVDPGVLGSSIGPPSVDINEKQDVRLLYDDDGTPRVIEGNDKGLSGTVSLGPPFAGAETPSVSVMNPAGGGVSAWPSVDPQGSPAVAVREDFPNGAVQTALVSGGAGGSIGELTAGRSGLGDGLVAFQQGPVGDAAIVATQVTAPPVQFVIGIPKGWVKPSRATVVWEDASSANGPLHYQVVLDGRRVGVQTSARASRLDPRGLGDGSHRVQVLATDIFGQSTLTTPSSLEIDGNAPVVKVTSAVGGHGVTVRISDAFSGVDEKALRVRFGDGQQVLGRRMITHRFARAGVYELVVDTRDKVGNSGVVRRLVHVR